MKKTTAAAIAAFTASVLLIAGCNGNNGGSGQTAADTATTETVSGTEDTRSLEIANEYFAGNADSFAAWKDVDRSKIIASVTEGSEDKEFFDITFGEFFSEYMYYLVSYKIADDMSEDSKATCEGYRDNIISYMTFERMYQYIADKEYGINESTLTQEQLDAIKTEAETVRTDWAANFYTTVQEKLGESATEEEINSVCDAALHHILGKCGLDESIFYKWELSKYIQDLLIEEIVQEKGEVSDSDVQSMFDEFLAAAKDKAENSPSEYEELVAYSMVYIPEGTRTAKQIFIGFSDEALTNIAQLTSDGDTEGAAKAAGEAYTDELKAKVAEISEKLAGGASFDELQSEYDTAGSSEMVVLVNSPSFFDEYRTALYSLENKGDVSEPVVYSNGIYFIQYSDDATVLESDIQDIKDSMRSYLQDYNAQAAQNEAYNEWMKRFPYTIDYETLKIDADSSLLSGVSD